MPRRLLVALALLVPLAGCVDAMVDQIEESREQARAEEAGDGSAVGSPAPPPPSPTPAPEGPWPRPGSRVEYALEGGTGAHESWATRVALTYDGRAWTGTCRGERTAPQADGSRVRLALDEQVGYAPPTGPLDRAPGDAVRIHVPSGCGLRALDLLVQGRFPEDTRHEDVPVRVEAWWADEGAAREPQVDEDAWWDAKTGLLLRWEAAEHATDRGVRGRLAWTDAPLG